MDNDNDEDEDDMIDKTRKKGPGRHRKSFRNKVKTTHSDRWKTAPYLGPRTRAQSKAAKLMIDSLILYHDHIPGRNGKRKLS